MKYDDCCLFVRARRPEQVAQRRDSILAAMAELLQEAKPEHISLNEVARRAGLAKSNLYRYFDSREAILLELLREDGRRWMDSIEAALSGLDGSDDIAAAAAAIATTTATESRMCQLLSQVSSVLEQNASDAAVLAFKQHSFEVLGRLVQALHRALPSVPLHDLGQSIHYVLVLIAGLWPQSHPSEAVRKALQQPSLSALQVDFEESLRQGLTLIFRGLACSP